MIQVNNAREAGTVVLAKRREALKQLLFCGAGLATLPTAVTVSAAESMMGNLKPSVSGLYLRDDTIWRMSGMGDGFKMTWSADDRQFAVLNDGTGWDHPPKTFIKRSLWSLSGQAPAVSVHSVPGYPYVDNSMEADDAPDYRGHSLLAVKGKVYQFLCALDREQDRLRHWNAAKLIYSDDGGHTWRNQDGSHPVQFENWDEQSSQNLAFFDTPGGCFSLLSFLQMGRDYGVNRDGYVYVYSPNGNVDGLMNQLMMFRVPVDRVADREAYEFFCGTELRGGPKWRKDIAERQPVHVFPQGWVNSTKLFPDDIVVEAWLPSVVYNGALGLYMMVATGTGCAPDGTEFARPGYLGFWLAATPWGPWRQVHEDKAWAPGGDPESRPYSVQIPPKWVAEDGKSLWLVWTDLKGIRSLAQAGNKLDTTPGPSSSEGKDDPDPLALGKMMNEAMPLYSLNAQRLDFRFDLHP